MVPILELIRLEEHETFGTLGILKIQKRIFCATLEPPDKSNQTDISSIPAQQYRCQRYNSHRHPDTFQVMNVPNRSTILFHAGNTVDNTAGCILLGQYVWKLKAYDRAVLNSGDTFRKFNTEMAGHDELHLTITEAY